MHKAQWRKDFDKAIKIQKERRRARLEKEKPVVVSGFFYIKKGKKIVVDEYRRKLPEKKPKFRKLKKMINE